MNKDLRRAIIAGNWKMNKTPSEAAKLIEELKAAMPEPDCEVVVCVPAIDIPAVAEAIKGSDIRLGAQNVHFEASGAFTGEISASMLAEMGVEYVIVGHSERRQYFGETNETVNLRAKAAINAGLTPIICVGETLEQREQGITDDLVSMQTKIAFNGIEKEDAINCVIAYEPVWAIGTGKTATAEQANEVCQLIRDTIGVLYDDETADGISIQYGGSMNAKNCAELLAMEDIDGGLIGGASLKAPDFSVIIEAASK
ncbi:MAG: triose-phosphate isomerase [Clostridia bacterium]|nr:triose-phosphate isomerase [Clostridia bacterium]MBR5769527.1 triose-phosphate isomerase [Clostridia bacterium]